MKIVSSMVAMRSQHTRMQITEQRESLRIRHRQAGPPPDTARPETRLATQAGTKAEDTASLEASGEELAPLDELKLGVLKMLLERLTGIKIKVLSTRELRAKLKELQDPGQEGLQQPPTRSPGEQPSRGDFALAYDYSYTRTESESTRVDMSAQVQTSDGKTIDVGIRLNLSRQLVQHEEFHLKAGDERLFDPLVLNFNGGSAQLTERQFQFDLNADGRAERIALLRPGSGFLALDRNGDGKVNDGSELFGPQSGNGFAELARYDQDGNRFIDEADAIFQQLKVWTRDANGEQRLLALGQAGVGAIYLGHIGSEFTLEDGNREQVGQLRDSGFFLREDGTSGTVQQIDLVV
jgi:hypothetical protein